MDFLKKRYFVKIIFGKSIIQLTKCNVSLYFSQNADATSPEEDVDSEEQTSSRRGRNQPKRSSRSSRKVVGYHVLPYLAIF